MPLEKSVEIPVSEPQIKSLNDHAHFIEESHVALNGLFRTLVADNNLRLRIPVIEDSNEYFKRLSELYGLLAKEVSAGLPVFIRKELREQSPALVIGDSRVEDVVVGGNMTWIKRGMGLETSHSLAFDLRNGLQTALFEFPGASSLRVQGRPLVYWSKSFRDTLDGGGQISLRRFRALID